MHTLPEAFFTSHDYLFGVFRLKYTNKTVPEYEKDVDMFSRLPLYTSGSH